MRWQEVIEQTRAISDLSLDLEQAVLNGFLVVDDLDHYLYELNLCLWYMDGLSLIPCLLRLDLLCLINISDFADEPKLLLWQLEYSAEVEADHLFVDHAVVRVA